MLRVSVQETKLFLALIFISIKSCSAFFPASSLHLRAFCDSQKNENLVDYRGSWFGMCSEGKNTLERTHADNILISHSLVKQIICTLKQHSFVGSVSLFFCSRSPFSRLVKAPPSYVERHHDGVYSSRSGELGRIDSSWAK